MKNEQKYWVANSQEDEDGFSLNPYDVYIYESTNTDQNFSINKSGIISRTHDEIFTIIASKEKEMNTKQQSSKRIITIRKN